MKAWKASLSLLLLFVIFSSLAQAGIRDVQQAQDLVIDRLLSGDLSDVRVLACPDRLDAGVDVMTWHKAALRTPSEGYVIFIDDLPYAKYEHSCRYVFVDAASGELTVSPATTPPLDAMSWIEKETTAYKKLMAAKNRRAPRSPNPVPPQKSSRGGELYAVLMSGGASQWSNHVRYWNDLSNIYITLVDVYGYKDENIIVLCSDGTNPQADQSNGENSDPDLDGDGDDDIMYSCVKSNITWVFHQLETTLTADDQLFVFATDHGGSNGGWSVYENLWNLEELQDYELDDMYDALPGCDIVTTMEQCYSGGFEDDLSGTNRVFSSAASNSESSWAMPPDYVYDTYVFFWTAAVKGEDAYGVPCNADLNGDDLISMHEAFIYAEANDISDETPQYESTPGTLGEEMTLFGTGKTWYVPADFSTIQAAIDAAEDNDTIRVSAGTYVQALDLLNKKITVESLDGPEATIIDGAGENYAVRFTGAYDDKSVLRGFTITNGLRSGVFCSQYASPLLIDDVIKDNGGNQPGGGCNCEYFSKPQFFNCIFADNTATYGGGISVTESSAPYLMNCTFCNNTASVAGGGVHSAAGTTTEIINSILWSNTPDQYDAADISYSNVQGGIGGTGNISRDPEFVDASCRLSATSPCINMGSLATVEEQKDIYGVNRVEFGLVDMGACECADCTLAAYRFELHPRKPAIIDFDLDFGPGCAGQKYIVLGATTRVPGYEVGGVVLPLNWDAYTDVVFANVNHPIFADFLGTLDANGTASPTLNWPGGGDVAWAGLTIYHAALTLKPNSRASNPVPVTFVVE